MELGFDIEKVRDCVDDAQARLDFIQDYLKEKATLGWELRLDERGVYGLRQVLFDAMQSISKAGSDSCRIGHIGHENCTQESH